MPSRVQAVYSVSRGHTYCSKHPDIALAAGAISQNVALHTISAAAAHLYVVGHVQGARITDGDGPLRPRRHHHAAAPRTNLHHAIRAERRQRAAREEANRQQQAAGGGQQLQGGGDVSLHLHTSQDVTQRRSAGGKAVRSSAA